MNYKLEFEELLEKCINHNQYVGLGNPNAKILFIGKEAGEPVKSKITHGSVKSWKDGEIDYSKSFVPIKPEMQNHRHTWQKYQKLYDKICQKNETNQSNKKNYKITFVENVFTTELSNLPAKTTNEAKQLEGFKTELKKRKNIFWKSKFIQDFPIVVITASDNNYIETYPGEVCEIFDVDFDKQVVCTELNKMWIHYSKNQNPKLVIHTRQLTNGASNELIDKIADIIIDFKMKNNISICNK